jgi:glycosyltransferase involved in cell wall biosynthesis
MMREHLDTCVVVPTYDEAAMVGSVVGALRTRFAHVLCIDDGSTDGSGQVARAAGATVVRHPVNLGAGAALQTGLAWGLRNPDFRYFVTFDADGQHRVEDAVAMLARARRDRLDVVLGSRFDGGDAHGMTASRRMTLWAAVRFTRLTTGLPLTDTHNGLRVLDRRAAERIRITLAGMAHGSELLAQVRQHGLSWAEHPVTIDYTDYSRAKGQPNINAINISLDLLGNRIRTATFGRGRAPA